jgi:rRNA processing protein Gar1
MKVLIDFSLDGASFRDDYFSEIRNVLQHAEHKLLFKRKDDGSVSIDEPEPLEGKLVDYNGNTIGKVQVVE